MQIVFMGTPDFAVGALEALITQGYEITAVVTQPDKPKGRSKELQFPPVKECAVKHGIPVFQPRRIKTPEAIEELKNIPQIFISWRRSDRSCLRRFWICRNTDV